MKRLPLVAILALAGCATAAPSGLAPTARPQSLFVSEGRAVAQTRCAACHAIDALGESPRSGAPPFTQIRLRFNAITWERAMRAIGEGGHEEMPAVSLDPSEIRDLRAYIDSLR